jgi:hypothetical protein
MASSVGRIDDSGAAGNWDAAVRQPPRPNAGEKMMNVGPHCFSA